MQENYFFDGDKQELESQRAVMRLRLFTDQEGRQKATITVKVGGWCGRLHPSDSCICGGPDDTGMSMKLDTRAGKAHHQKLNASL
jgi:hypothetical protein